MPENYPTPKTVVKNLPEGIWNAPSTPVPQKLKPVDPPSLESILADIDRTGEKLHSDIERYEATKNGEPEVDARRRELISLLADWEPRVKAARQELTEIEARPTPFARFMAAVANAEQGCFQLAHAALSSLYQHAAKRLFDQDYRTLSEGSRRDIRGMDSHRGITSISNTGFTRFGRAGTQGQNLAFAYETIKRVQESLIKLGETISKAQHKGN